jgi:hypothetical protein
MCCWLISGLACRWTAVDESGLRVMPAKTLKSTATALYAFALVIVASWQPWVVPGRLRRCQYMVVWPRVNPANRTPLLSSSHENATVMRAYRYFAMQSCCPAIHAILPCNPWAPVCGEPAIQKDSPATNLVLLQVPLTGPWQYRSLRMLTDNGCTQLAKACCRCVDSASCNPNQSKFANSDASADAGLLV